MLSINFDALAKLRLAPPSERYQRIADRGDALGFASELAEALPRAGAKVFYGGTRGAGYVVVLGDDWPAAMAAGADFEIAFIKARCE